MRIFKFFPSKTLANWRTFSIKGEICPPIPPWLRACCKGIKNRTENGMTRNKMLESSSKNTPQYPKYRHSQKKSIISEKYNLVVKAKPRRHRYNKKTWGYLKGVATVALSILTAKSEVYHSVLLGIKYPRNLSQKWCVIHKNIT